MPTPTAVSPPLMTVPPFHATLLGRQPILGRDRQIIAYTLAVQDPSLADDQDATLPLAHADLTTADASGAFANTANGLALGTYRAFVSVDGEFLFSERLQALPVAHVFLDLADSVVATPDILDRCQALRAAGFALVVRAVRPAVEGRQALLALADVVGIALLDADALDAAPLAADLARWRSAGKTLLALDVDTPERLALGQRLGFDLFRGYGYARTVLHLNRHLNPSQIALLGLLGLVLEDADTAALEKAFKHEPGLTLNLLRLTNSVAGGLRTRVTSLRHAIALLGRRQLQQWLQLLIYSGNGAQSVNPLLQLAATRGRLMELLADSGPTKNRELADQAYMTGILSLMPVLLGVALPEIIARLPLGPRVAQALSERSGHLGLLLNLVEATEQPPAPSTPDATPSEALAEALRAVPGINTRQLGASLAQAMQWANALGQEAAVPATDDNGAADA